MRPSSEEGDAGQCHASFRVKNATARRHYSAHEACSLPHGPLSAWRAPATAPLFFDTPGVCSAAHVRMTAACFEPPLFVPPAPSPGVPTPHNWKASQDPDIQVALRPLSAKTIGLELLERRKRNFILNSRPLSGPVRHLDAELDSLPPPRPGWLPGLANRGPQGQLLRATLQVLPLGRHLAAPPGAEATVAAAAFLARPGMSTHLKTPTRHLQHCIVGQPTDRSYRRTTKTGIASMLQGKGLAPGLCGLFISTPAAEACANALAGATKPEIPLGAWWCRTLGLVCGRAAAAGRVSRTQIHSLLYCLAKELPS